MYIQMYVLYNYSFSQQLTVKFWSYRILFTVIIRVFNEIDTILWLLVLPSNAGVFIVIDSHCNKVRLTGL
jgi:hypothetical protein